MLTPDDHVREVLARDSGWVLRGDWLVLDGPVGGHVIIHDPGADTWGRTYLLAGDTVYAPPELVRRAWTLGYFSAAAAADDAEEVARLTVAAVAALR